MLLFASSTQLRPWDIIYLPPFLPSILFYFALKQVINRSPKYKNKYVHRRSSISLENLTPEEVRAKHILSTHEAYLVEEAKFNLSILSYLLTLILWPYDTRLSSDRSSALYAWALACLIRDLEGTAWGETVITMRTVHPSTTFQHLHSHFKCQTRYPSLTNDMVR